MQAITDETTRLPAPGANAAYELILNLGRGVTDTCPVPATLTWCELVTQFSVPDTQRGKLPLAQYQALDKKDKAQKKTRDAEKDGSYFIMGAFSKPGTRDGDDITFMSGFTGDIDSGKISKACIQAKLTGYQYLVYSSYSHRPDVPMWRFILPYCRAVTAAEHEKVYAFLQKEIDDQLDKRCKTTAQLWYTPACPPDAGPYFEFFTGEGDLLNPDLLPDVVPAPSRKGTALAVLSHAPLKSLPVHQLDRIKSALASTPANDRDLWIRVGLALRQDLGAETGYPIWLEWSKMSIKFDEDDAEATWNSFKDSAPGAAVTLGTVFFLAKDNGWIDDRRDMPEKVQSLDDVHFMAFEGGKCWVFKEDYDQELGRAMLTRIALKPFTDFYANQRISMPVGEGFRMINIGSAWHEHPARRSFEKIVFMPGMPTPPGCYNLWRGFPYPPIQGDWGRLQQHLHDVICGGDVQCTEYLLNWMANAIQYPDRLGEVAIVMKGDRGTGKGKFAHLFSKLFGEHSLQINQAKHLVGNFNAHLRSCVFLFVDEALWAGDKQGENVLKGLVTEPTLQIEKKGVDTGTSRNRLHIMMASNSDWVVPAGGRERRFCVLKVSDARIQDHAYFAAIDNQMLNQGGLSAMMYDLTERDLSAFNVRNYPQTDALDEQKLHSLEPGMLWWMDYLGETYSCWQFQSRTALNESFAKAKGTYNEKSSTTQLGMFLNKVVPGGVKKVPHSLIQSAPPQPCYEFPDQQKCRQELMDQLGLKKDPWL